MRAQLLSACLLAFGCAAAQSADASFTGYARSLDKGVLLYVESHAVTDAGTPAEKRVVLYRCGMDAAPFARKELSYGAERMAPAFSFDDARSGYSEGFKRDASGREVFERAGSAAKLRSGNLPAGQLVADAGFDEFVRDHWEDLQRGNSLEVPFLVPSRLNSVNFRVKKVGEVQIEGEAASVFRLSVAGPIGWFLSDIDISYRQRDRRLMRYRGITNVRDVGGDMIAAQIDFPDSERSDSAVSLASLRALPLVSHCR